MPDPCTQPSNDGEITSQQQGVLRKETSRRFHAKNWNDPTRLASQSEASFQAVLTVRDARSPGIEISKFLVTTVTHDRTVAREPKGHTLRNATYVQDWVVEEFCFVAVAHTVVAARAQVLLVSSAIVWTAKCGITTLSGRLHGDCRWSEWLLAARFVRPCSMGALMLFLPLDNNQLKVESG